MQAVIISSLVAVAVGGTFPWPLHPVPEPLYTFKDTEPQYYRGFGTAETLIDTVDNPVTDEDVIEPALNVLSACYNIARMLDEHVSGCWTGEYIPPNNHEDFTGALSDLKNIFYDGLVNNGMCKNTDGGSRITFGDRESLDDLSFDDDVNENFRAALQHCKDECTREDGCRAFEFIYDGVTPKHCDFFGEGRYIGDKTAPNAGCFAKSNRVNWFQVYVSYTSECQDCIPLDASEFVTPGGIDLSNFEDLRKFPDTAFDPIVSSTTAAPVVTNALDALEARVSALEPTQSTSGSSSTSTSSTAPPRTIYVKPVSKDDDTEFGSGVVDIFYTRATASRVERAVRISFGQIGELSRAFCEVACTRDIQCVGYSTPSIPFLQPGESAIPADYPCILMSPHETHLGTTVESVRTLVNAGDAVFLKQYKRLDPDTIYATWRSTRWAFVRKSLLSKQNELTPLEGEDGVATIEDCGKRCVRDPECSLATWISPWQPCYKTPPAEELFYGGERCAVASEPSLKIMQPGTSYSFEYGTIECEDEEIQGFIEGGIFALVLDTTIRLPSNAGVNFVTLLDLGAQRRFWVDPFVRCDADCQARCGDGSEFLRLVPVRVEADPPVRDAANTLTITIHDCPNVVEIEVERADHAYDGGRLTVTFGAAALTNLPRLRKFSWLSTIFASVTFEEATEPLLTSCVHYAGNTEVTLGNWANPTTDPRHGPHTYLGVVADGADDTEPVPGFPDDAETYHCIPCNPDPDAVFSGGRGGNLENVKIVSHRFFSECPEITEAVAPALLYPEDNVVFFPGDADHQKTVDAWKYQPRSPYLEKLTIPATNHIIRSDKVVSSRIVDADAGTTEYTLQPCAETDLTVETFREPGSGHHILDADTFRGCLMESVTISTTRLLKIKEGAFVGTPNLFRVTLNNRYTENAENSEIENGAFDRDSITDLFVAGGTRAEINDQLVHISRHYNTKRRTSIAQYVLCRKIYRRPGCFSAALDTSTLTTAVGVTSPACGPGTYNVGPLVDVLHESDRSMDILGMTRIKIVRPEDEAEKTVQVPTGRLSTMCHPVGTLPADSASEYSGFPPPAPLRAPEDSGALPDRVPAHIADPSNGLPVWATLLVGLGSAAVLFGGFTLVSRRKVSRV